jgi:hypothetical protein
MRTHLAAYIAAYLLLAGAAPCQEIGPNDPVDILKKDIKIMTALERSEIIIDQIYEPPEMEQIGTPAMTRRDTTVFAEPFGWQAYVSQEIAVGWPGSWFAYQEMT